MFESYKQYNNWRYTKIISLIKKTNSKLLDVGCGDGFLEHMLGQHKFNITGLDISEDCIKQANKNFPNSNYFVYDACKTFPFKDNTFDIIISNGLIEHVKKPSNVIKECLRVCKRVCIIGTPNAWHFDLYFNTQKQSLSKSVLQYYSPNVLRGLIRKFNGKINYINLSALIPPFKYIIIRCIPS